MTSPGDIAAHLRASTTGSDADWVVKLIDVYPDASEPDPKLNGYELMVANDVLRGRFRKSFEHPEAITPGYEFGWDTHIYNFEWLQDLHCPIFDRARLPVGVDFIARPFDEPMLFRVASAYEAATRHRTPPPDFGPVPGEP